MVWGRPMFRVVQCTLRHLHICRLPCKPTDYTGHGQSSGVDGQVGTSVICVLLQNRRWGVLAPNRWPPVRYASCAMTNGTCRCKWDSVSQHCEASCSYGHWHSCGAAVPSLGSHDSGVAPFSVSARVIGSHSPASNLCLCCGPIRPSCMCTFGQELQDRHVKHMQWAR